MKPIKPKYMDTARVTWKISKRSKEIISQYAKYTKYEEDEIVDRLITDILEDEKFLEWLNSRRFKKKIQDVIFEDNSPSEGITEITEGDADFEEIKEGCEL